MKKLQLLLCGLLLTLLLPSCGSEKAPLTIAGNDASSYSIVIADGADFDTRYAAYRLQKTLSDRYGIVLPILPDATEPTGREILLGNASRQESEILDVDEYALRIEKGNLVLDAGHYAGTCAALQYLENYLSRQGTDAKIDTSVAYRGKTAKIFL